MDLVRRPRVLFRLCFSLYLLAILGWLALGLLPVLATHSAAFAGRLAGVANGSGVWSTLAGRALESMTEMSAPGWSSLWGQYLFSVLNLVLGLLLVIRRPDDLVPRLLGVAFLGTAATFNLPSHALFHLLGNPWPIAVVHFGVHLLSGLCYCWAVVLFPDGRLPRHWRQPWTTAVAVLASAAVVVICWTGSFLSHPQFFVVFFGILVPLVGLAAQASRLTDSTTTAEAARVARLLCGAVLPAALVAAGWLIARAMTAIERPLGATAESVDTWLGEVFPAVFALIPVVLTVGVVRYRLWDVDRLLSKVLSYGLVVGGAGVAVVAVSASTTMWLGGGWWLPALVLSVLATVLEPARQAAGRWANRVVFGRVLSPAEATRALAGGLAQTGASGDLDRLTMVAVAATRADRVAVWIGSGDTSHCLADSGGGDSGGSERAGSDSTAELHTWPIHQGGSVVGRLTAHAPGDHFTRADRRMLADLAGHAGPMVYNAGLVVMLAADVAELARRVDILRMHRRNVVAAQDAERRRLERNLHDGAQQALVAVLIGLRTLVRSGSTGPQGQRAAAELVAIVVGAEDELAQLCGGKLPAALDAGLGVAIDRLAALTARTGPDVDVTIDPAVAADRSEAAAAVYFACAEALQNCSKHAAATRVTIRVGIEDDRLTFAVHDDGRGFDPGHLAAATHGGVDQCGADRGGVNQDGVGQGGLGPLLDRLRARGGELTVRSAVGMGTEVLGSVPRERAAEPAMAGGRR